METINNSVNQLPKAESVISTPNKVGGETGAIKPEVLVAKSTKQETEMAAKVKRFKYVSVIVVALTGSLILCLLLILLLTGAIKNVLPEGPTPISYPQESIPVSQAIIITTPIGTATPVATADPYAGWRDQKLAGFGLQLKLPSNWTYKDNSLTVNNVDVIADEGFLKDPSKKSKIKYIPAYQLSNGKITIEFDLAYGIGFCEGVATDPENNSVCVTKDYKYKIGGQEIICKRIGEVEKSKVSQQNSLAMTIDCEGLPTGKSSSWKGIRILGGGAINSDFDSGAEFDKILKSIILI